MKKDYLKKDFLPDQYVVENLLRAEKENKELVFILLIGVILLLPITVNKLSQNIDNKEEVVLDEYFIEEDEGLDISNLEDCLKLFSDDDNGVITEKKCEIETRNYYEKSEQLSLHKISDISLLNEGRYKIVIERE